MRRLTPDTFAIFLVCTVVLASILPIEGDHAQRFDLATIYLAFLEAVVEGMWHTFSVADIAVVILVDMLLLAVLVCIAMFGSRALGFSKQDKITITFCGSKKSLASGVPMPNAIFANQTSSLGAVALPLMPFHQIQLMACAVVADEYATRIAGD